MTEAMCGGVSALTLGLPRGCAIDAAKGTLPKAMFAGREPLSNTLRQHFTRDVASVHLLALLRPGNAQVAEGARIREVMVLGLRLAGEDAAAPKDVIEHIAAQRPGSGALFALVRDGHADGAQETTVEQCALAVRRQVPGRAGHVAQFAVHVGPWTDPKDILLELTGATMDELWDSLCSQAILGTTDHANLDARLLRQSRVRALKTEEARLTRDHARAKNPTQRNEIFAKLHKIRKELAELSGM